MLSWLQDVSEPFYSSCIPCNSQSKQNVSLELTLGMELHPITQFFCNSDLNPYSASKRMKWFRLTMKAGDLFPWILVMLMVTEHGIPENIYSFVSLVALTAWHSSNAPTQSTLPCMMPLSILVVASNTAKVKTIELEWDACFLAFSLPFGVV